MGDGLKIAYLQVELLNWFQSNRRDFPWRQEEAGNYGKIISEVLLQRTKAGRVALFYPNFIKKYPDWNALANVSEAQLQADLQTLGLHRQRGHRLYRLAQEMKRRKGNFPDSREIVEEFSMMGQYIANAFELFVLKKPKPLLDVNMARFLERQFEGRRKADIRYDPFLQGLAHQIVDHRTPVLINWAILDFAALICVARKPKCDICPVSGVCNYFQQFALTLH